MVSFSFILCRIYYELRLLRRTQERDTTYDWQQYDERLEYFFAANGITDAAKKRAVFLSVIGACTYKTLRNILSPAKPGEKEYSELVDKLSQHFRPAPSEIVEQSLKEAGRVSRHVRSRVTFIRGVLQLRRYVGSHDS